MSSAVLEVQHAHDRRSGEVAELLATDLGGGLDDREAARRLAEVGPNRLPSGTRPGHLRIAARQLADPLVLLLVAAAAVSAGIGETVEAAVIAAIVVLNGVFGFVQEVGAERAVLALRDSEEPTAAVVRAGCERLVSAEELVPGDLVVLREGERVPADVRVVDSQRLLVDESALTGESVPVAKEPGAVGSDTPLAERSCMAFAGTGVTRGRGRAVVVATGAATELGSVVRLTEEAGQRATPLHAQLGRLSRGMVALGLALTAVLSLALLAQGTPVHEAFLVGVSVAVAAVPEGLAASVTIALAQGARAMAVRGALVRRLDAVETVGLATLLAADKTGTLTVNELRVAGIWPAPGHTAADVLETGALASVAELSGGEDERRVVGDPVDGAFLLAAEAGGLDDPRVARDRRRLREVPFEPRRQRLTVVWHDAGVLRAVVKGAPEALLARAHGDAKLLALVAETAQRWAEEGLRVLAVGEARPARVDVADEELDDCLEVLGLVALHDPLRPTAAASLALARHAGVRVAMLTGDHPATATAIARTLDLAGARDPVTGTEIDRLGDDDLAAVIERTCVFARVTPAHKLRLVEAFQARGDVVAVTGDGVNDAPALRRADVGLAMGRSGTEAARRASEIVLTDDDAATIVAAIAEGRRIDDNLHRFVAFLLSANLGEVILFSVAVLAGLGAPMTVVQILLVNLLTDGLPAIALARDPASPETMSRGPRRSRQLFTRELWVALGLAGTAIGVAATVAYLLGRELAPESAQTMAFATIALAELAFVYTIRSARVPAWRGPRNPALAASVVASAAIVGAAIYVPPLSRALGTVPLDAAELAAVGVLALLPFALVETVKALAPGLRS